MAQDLRTAGPRDTHLYEFLGTRRQPAVFSIYSRWSLLLTTATILGLTALATIGFRHQSETLSHAFRRPKSHESALTNSDTAVLDADDPFRMEDDTYGVPYLAEQEAYESFDSLRYDDPATVDNIAIAIKISRETVKTRLAPILGTYADRFKHRIYVSDHQDSIGSTPVFDVYNGIYEESLQILKQRKIEYAMYKPPNRGLQTDGWERDAEKFLPGFKRLYETFPESDWFLMVDDDSYVFTRNLADIVKGLDPNDVHHMGYPTSCGRCGINYDKEEGSDFYQAGAGIFLSRGAMEILYDAADLCIYKHWDCPFGDGRVGMCLQDAGIPIIQGRPQPYGFRAHDFRHMDPEFGWPADPCRRVLTGHRMRGHDLQDAYEAEETAENDGQITFGHLFQARYRNSPLLKKESSELVQSESGLESIGPGNTPVSRGEDEMNCSSRCRALDECRGWTYELSSRSCWLLTNQDDATFRPRSNLVSALLVDRYICRGKPVPFERYD